MRDSVVDLTRELVERESENPPGNEQAVADYLVERLGASPVPFAVETYDVEPGRPNVVATVGDPDRGTVLLTGHVDVVPSHADDWSQDPYELGERDGRVVGRGTADMKGALAAKLLATEAYYQSTDDPGSVILAFVIDEEDQGRGTRALIERGIDADAAIIGEPTDMQVCVAQKGVVRYDLTVRGRSGHAGTPDDAVNAITGLRRVLDRVEELDGRLRQGSSHPLLDPETVTVTEVVGGLAPNVVPDLATATLDWRFHPGTTTPEPLDDRLSASLDGLTLNDERLPVEWERKVFARAAEIASDHNLVREVQAAADAAGLHARAVGFNAATDARFLVHDAGIPTVLFGPGSIERDAHTVDESVLIDELVSTVDTYRFSLDRLLG